MEIIPYVAAGTAREHSSEGLETYMVNGKYGNYVAKWALLHQIKW